MSNPIRQVVDALDHGTDPREVLQRFGMEAVRGRRLGELLRLLEDFDATWGAATMGRWAADLVDAGHLVPRDEA